MTTIPSASIASPDSVRTLRIQGLRNLADFLEAHPEIPAEFQTFNVYFTTREELAAVARLGSWEKVYAGDYFILRRMFGGVQLDVYTDREKVCRPVVTGTRTVAAIPASPEHEENVIEWVCETESLLK